MVWLKFGLSAVVTITLIVVLDSRLGTLPPLGPFVDPFGGFWQNGLAAPLTGTDSIEFKGLKGRVRVDFDARGVPHIFAEHTWDLYWAQGYVTARDRLWQMEFQTAAAAGRLAEIVGADALGYDRFQRRIGMVAAAEAALDAIKASPPTHLALSAYAAGVNAYIDGLAADEYPLEYKLLDYRPEPWTLLKTALMAKALTWTLSGRSLDRQLSAHRARWGNEVIEDLFPDFPAGSAPVVPLNRVWDFKPPALQVPPQPFAPGAAKTTPQPPEPRSGSNNWVLSGQRTANGLPLLANDPHLSLTLPSVWYEIQLTGPDCDVYGVSVPGAPSVIVGFNRQIAWGMTNGNPDVLDWYEIQFRDQSRQHYWYDGAWQETSRRIEKIGVRGEDTVLDTVVYTHHGPIVWDRGEAPVFAERVPPGRAMRWQAHDPSNEWMTFYLLNRAETYADFKAALVHFVCPVQNFVFAGTDGDIALWHAGRLPQKWQGQGKYILDGADPRHQWQGWVPFAENPHLYNPERGYVFSANQPPAGPEYPHYLNWDYAYYRARRLEARIADMQEVGPEDMRLLQLDSRDLLAAELLPLLLGLLPTEPLPEAQQAAVEVLKAWDGRFEPEAVGATIFDQWSKQLFGAIWDDEFGAGLRPSPQRTQLLIAEKPEARWFDDITTDAEETLDQLVSTSLRKACWALERRLGPLGPAWAWGHAAPLDVPHLARIPGLGRAGVVTGGTRRTLQARSRSFGASWRMVVELGDQVRGWGIYPGGQSGHPGSRQYDNFVDQWAAGQLDELHFFSPARADSAVVGSLVLVAGP